MLLFFVNVQVKDNIDHSMSVSLYTLTCAVNLSVDVEANFVFCKYCGKYCAQKHFI